MAIARCSRSMQGWKVLASLLHKPEDVIAKDRLICYMSQSHYCKLFIQNRMKLPRSYCTYGKNKKSRKKDAYFKLGLSNYLEKNKVLDDKTFTFENKDSDRDIHELAPAEAVKLKVLQLEHEVLRLKGEAVPALMENKDWMRMLSLEAESKGPKQKMAYYRYTLKKELAQLKKLEKRRQGLTKDKAEKFAAHLYLCQYDTHVENYLLHNLYCAWMFSQKIIIDCEFEDMYTPREVKETAKQIIYTLGINYKSQDPLYPLLCNIRLNGRLATYLSRILQKDSLEEASEYLRCTLSEKSYLDLFPEENLVYLTPHSNIDYRYNERDIFVIGGIVDLTNHLPVSFATAKEKKLRHARLPLQKHCKLKHNTKLPINIVVQICHLLSTTNGNMKAALKAAMPNRNIEYWYD